MLFIRANKMVYCIRLIVNAEIYALAKQERVKEHDRDRQLSPTQSFLNTPMRPGVIRSGRRLILLTDTLTGTLVELYRLLAQDFTITILTGTVELRFLKRGCLRSDNLAADRYHNGPLRKQFPPLIMPTMPWIETQKRWARFVIHQSLTTTVVWKVLLSKSTLSPDEYLQ